MYKIKFFIFNYLGILNSSYIVSILPINKRSGKRNQINKYENLRSDLKKPRKT